MNYLLDSDVVIDYFKKKDPGYLIVKKLFGQKLSLSIISWIEIVYGIKKSNNVSKRWAEMDVFIKGLDVVVVPVEIAIADRVTDLKIELEKKGQKLADFDLLIAGTALVNNLVLVTGNKKHFKRITGLKLYV